MDYREYQIIIIEASNAQLVNRTGEEIVDADIALQMKR